MRTAIFILLLISCLAPAIVAEPLKDARLAQRVTYRVRLRPIADLTSDLTQMTHVTFTAGRSNSDWRVREDCATVIAKDVPLASLMDSIARALRFRWVRSGAAPNWSYRLTEDPAAIAAVDRRKNKIEKDKATHRRRLLDQAQTIDGLSEKQMADLRQKEPWLCFQAEAGILKPILDLFRQVPEIREAFISGKETSISAAQMPSPARKLLLEIAKADSQTHRKLWPNSTAGFDTEPVLAQLEKKMEQMTVDTDGSVLMVRAGELAGAYVTLAPPEMVTEVFGRVYLRALDQNRPYSEVRKEMSGEVRAALQVVRDENAKSEVGISRSDSCEPKMDHAPDPALARRLSSRISSEAVSAMVLHLADAGGSAIVTDDLRGKTGLAFDKDSPLRDALDRINDARQTNWSRNGSVIEIWRRDWFDVRASRISKAWLAALRERFAENGTYGIDDLAEIACLTQEQFSANFSRIFANSDRYVGSDSLECLRVYASLDADQRAALFSDSGVYVADLSLEQQQNVLKIARGQTVAGLPSLDFAALGARVVASKEKQGKRYVYTFRAYTNLGQIPGQLRLRTPVYVPPKPRKTTPLREAPAQPAAAAPDANK